MRTWSITNAPANFSDVFDEALKNGPQRMERPNGEPFIMIAESDWNRLAIEYPTMADLILNAPMDFHDMPERRPARVIARHIF